MILANGGSKAVVMRASVDGPCGDTSVSDVEVAEAKRLFDNQVSTVTSGLSIVQQLAVDASTGDVCQIGRPPTGGNCDDARPRCRPSVAANSLPMRANRSTKVINSHLQYFHKYVPFRDGVFSKDTLYGFLFFTVVENRLRMSYAKRVLRNLLSYARRYLTENPIGGVADGDSSGGRRMTVPLMTNDDRRSSVLEIRLTPASLEFFKDNPRGTVVQAKQFYRLMNSVGNQTNNERLKNIVCEARRPRELVFSDDQNADLLRFVHRALRVMSYKYSTRGSMVLAATAAAVFHSRIESAVEAFISPEQAADTGPRQMTAERIVFEFCVAFLLAFLTGARVKSTVMRLTLREFDALTGGVTLEKFAKGSFVRLFVPAQFLEGPAIYDGGADEGEDNSGSTAGVDADTTRRLRWNVYNETRAHHRNNTGNDDGGNDESTGRRILRDIAVVRRNPYLYESDKRSDRESAFFTNTGRQLDHAFDRVYATLFARARPKGVFWHSQRRRYLGAVNDRYGAVTASKSVGHADVESTMMYINRSMHGEDTNRRAGTAIYEDALRLMTRGANS